MIGLNAILLSPFSGGVGTYIDNLLNYLSKIIPADALRIYLSTENYKKYRDAYSFSTIKTPLSAKYPFMRILIENMYWRNQLNKDNIHIFHSPFSYLPYNLNKKSIVTIHDLRVYRYPETYTKYRRMFLLNAIKNSIYRSSKIIAVSEFTKTEILNLFNVPSEKIEVIYEGLDNSKFLKNPKNEDQKILKQFGIQDRYIFSVGHLEPRKNFLKLIKAYEIILNKSKQPIQLVIGGKKNYLYNELFSHVEKKRLNNKVIFCGFLPDDDLKVLYRNASVFAFPSIYEGFGFTPLESLASGVAVAASNVASIPEILGESAIYFDPYSSEDIADKILQLINNPNLGYSLLKNSNQILKKYSWATCAEKTYQLYLKLINSNV